VTLSKAALEVDANKRPKCGVFTLRKILSTADLALFNEWLSDPNRTSTWISEVLRADGHNTSDFTIQRHRRGKCSCAE